MAYTRIDAYRESLEFLDAAIEAMDQAVAAMKDAKVDPQARCCTSWQAPRQVLSTLLGLRENLAKTECDNCGKTLPCSCAWLYEEVR